MKIVVIGDSFIGGFGAQKNECWVSLLDNLIDYEVVNKGINGDTSLGILARFYNDVVSFKPKYAIIDGGWNDFLTGVDTCVPKDAMMSLVHQAYANNIIPIVMSIPSGNASLFKDNWPSFIDIESLMEKYREYASWLKEFCKGFSVFYIDCFSYTDNDDFRYNRYIDGIHMDKKGHEMIAEFVKNELEKIGCK